MKTVYEVLDNSSSDNNHDCTSRYEDDDVHINTCYGTRTRGSARANQRRARGFVQQGSNAGTNQRQASSTHPLASSAGTNQREASLAHPQRSSAGTNQSRASSASMQEYDYGNLELCGDENNSFLW